MSAASAAKAPGLRSGRGRLRARPLHVVLRVRHPLLRRRASSTTPTASSRAPPEEHLVRRDRHALSQRGLARSISTGGSSPSSSAPNSARLEEGFDEIVIATGAGRRAAAHPRGRGGRDRAHRRRRGALPGGPGARRRASAVVIGARLHRVGDGREPRRPRDVGHRRSIRPIRSCDARRATWPTTCRTAPRRTACDSSLDGDRGDRARRRGEALQRAHDRGASCRSTMSTIGTGARPDVAPRRGGGPRARGDRRSARRRPPALPRRGRRVRRRRLRRELPPRGSTRPRTSSSAPTRTSRGASRGSTRPAATSPSRASSGPPVEGVQVRGRPHRHHGGRGEGRRHRGGQRDQSRARRARPTTRARARSGSSSSPTRRRARPRRADRRRRGRGKAHRRPRRLRVDGRGRSTSSRCMDLSYAPPYSPVYDPLLVAARAAAKVVEGGWRAEGLSPARRVARLDRAGGPSDSLASG